MTRTRIYLIIQAVLCVLLVVLLSVSAVTIYREGVARKAEHPLGMSSTALRTPGSPMALPLVPDGYYQPFRAGRGLSLGEAE